jgi:hypothetical protein
MLIEIVGVYARVIAIIFNVRDVQEEERTNAQLGVALQRYRHV